MNKFEMTIIIILGIIIGILFILFIWDRYIQTKNIVRANFPLIGRLRYIFHDLRPFFRQYFGDDNSFAPRIIIDWIRNVAEGQTGYFSFDKFDTTEHLHDGMHQMIHSTHPLNNQEVDPIYPVVGEKRKNPLRMRSYFYRSAMSLGSIGFEATSAMAAGCVNAHVAFNTGEGGLSIHHLPKLKYQTKYKFLKSIKIPKIFKPLYLLTPGARAKTYIEDFLGWLFCPKKLRDVYLFDYEHFLFYAIDWEAPYEHFPKPEELHHEFGDLILQIGSGLYGMRKKEHKDPIFDEERFKKVSSFCRAIEIKLAQGAKQTGGILKAVKNTPAVAEIRGVKDGIDLISQNRFPFYNQGEEKQLFDFVEKLSELSGGKPVGVKIVISSERNIIPLAKQLAETPKEKGLDFITIDGGDGGSATAPIALGILFGKTIFESIAIANKVLRDHGVRNRIKLFASSKVYAPHMSARALALGADAIGIARGIMIAGGCIRAGLCSGEHGPCPIGMATLEKSKTRAYKQAIKQKEKEISNYLNAHHKGLIQVAAICGLKSPSLLSREHLVNPEATH